MTTPSTPSTPSDATLASLAREGSRDAFRDLVARYQGSVLNLVRRAVPDRAEAEDVAQEVFLQAWRALDRYDPGRRFSTWLYTIASRRAVSHLRRARIRTTAEVPAEWPDGNEAVDPARVAARRDEARALWSLADEVLAPAQRLALWLRYAEDLDAAEIGRVLDRSTVAVRLLLHRARRTLAARAHRGLLAHSFESESESESSPSGVERHA